MANFSANAVEALDYDFTGFPSNSGKGNCKGKGTVSEPTQARIEEYTRALRELFDVDTSERPLHNPKEALEAALAEPGDDSKDGSASKATQAARQAALLSLTAQLCNNSPSADELTDLPPRIRNAFMKWVYKELSDPEVSGADIRR